MEARSQLRHRPTLCILRDAGADVKQLSSDKGTFTGLAVSKLVE